MSQPASWPSASTLVDGWRVQIDMPVFHDGKNRGKPVGWLNLNNVAGGAGARISRSKVKTAWRIAARDAYRRQRVPQGLDRVAVSIELRFPDALRRDAANYEYTIKPVIDALQPEEHKQYHSQRTGKKEWYVAYGWGVIPGDDDRYLRRLDTTIGAPLGRSHPIKGMVIVTIYPVPVSIDLDL